MAGLLRSRALSVLCIVALFAFGPASAEEPSAEDIVKQLEAAPGQTLEVEPPMISGAPPPTSGPESDTSTNSAPSAGMSLDSAMPKSARPYAPSPSKSLVQQLKTKNPRHGGTEARAKVADLVKTSDLKAMDLEIYFDYGSAGIAPSSIPTLVQLGKALSDERLKGRIFMIAGHTDGKGGTSYNQQLSQRRAEAVKTFLGGFGLEASQLIPVGYGKEQLKNADDPFAAENRRVQIVNLAQK